MTDVAVNGRLFKLAQCEVMRFEDEFGHSYEIDGEPVAGVTTLLSMGVPPEQGLLEYFKRTDKESQEDILLDAQQRGTNVHQAVEDLLNGISVPSAVFTRKREKLAIEAFVAWFEAMKPTDIVTEQVVAYVEKGTFLFPLPVKFAGTLDCLCTINGHRLLIDFKTSAVPSTKDKLQVQAYKAAIEQSTTEKIDDCYVLYLGTSHKGTRPSKHVDGLPTNGPGWSMVYSNKTFADFMLAYNMALLMNGGNYPKPPTVVAFPEQWKILERSLKGAK